MALQMKPHSSLVTGLNCLKRLEKVVDWCTAQCKMLLLCAKAIVKESHIFELACLNKKKNILAIW